MARQRPRKKSPKLDMNPMVDMAFLLVTFFMLATSFRAEEPVNITIPFSISELQLPETGVLTFYIAPDGRAFFQIDGEFSRLGLLQHLSNKYEIELTKDEVHAFQGMNAYGVPMDELKGFLQQDEAARRRFIQPGIPYTPENNELTDWIVYARVVNPRLRIAIKADKDTPYANINGIIKTLTDNRVLRFNLVTYQKGGDAL